LHGLNQQRLQLQAAARVARDRLPKELGEGWPRLLQLLHQRQRGLEGIAVGRVSSQERDHLKERGNDWPPVVIVANQLPLVELDQ
jgi:hypothetical protein